MKLFNKNTRTYFISCKGIYFLTILLLALFNCPSLFAQTDKDNFKRMGLGINITRNINENQFHHYWKKATGLEVNSEIDFYKGRIQLGLNASEFSSRESGTPGFTALFTYLGWGARVNLPRNINWFNSVQAGVFYMKFDDEEPIENWRSENEIGIGLYSRLQYNIDKKWRINVFARYLKIYTHKRIYHSYIGSGMSYRFTTPGWLKDFLR
jgi:hypothetical protein